MPVVPSLDVERYLDFKEMTSYLRDVGKAAPHLVRIFSIGKSREGRPLLVAEVTNRNLKKGRDKPGLWVDGGHQGWNLLGTMACLELIRFLVSGHGRDEFLTDLVDNNVFYIAPRLAPDEMEVCLASGAIMPQVSERLGPHTSPLGKQFRIESPLGGWALYKRDARILVRRQPEDRKGPFYDLYRDLDSSRLSLLNVRDFPSRYLGGEDSDLLQLNSTRAIFEFMRSYKNIFGVISTSGPGELLSLQGSSGQGTLYAGLGQRLAELAGLPYRPVEEERAFSGLFLNWAADCLGLLALDCKMWSLRSAAGLKEVDNLLDPLACEEAEAMQLIRFCEKEFPEGSFSPWTTAEDAELGVGELGGWDWSRTWLNPPAGPYLSKELKRFSRLALGLASAGPRLVIAEVTEKMLGWSSVGSGKSEPLRHLSIRVENRGYLPTWPLGGEPDEGARLTFQYTKGEAQLLIGSASTPIGDLQGTGFARIDDGLPYAKKKYLPDTKQLVVQDLLFQGQAEIEITVSHPMAGTDKVVSRPTQILKPPTFEQPTIATVFESEDVTGVHSSSVFEDAFPSFEELYNEEPETLKEAPAVQTQPVSHQPLGLTRASEDVPKPSVASVVIDSNDEFNIPMPVPKGKPPATRRVEFPSIESKTSGSTAQEPFPQIKPPKGRILGAPPQKPGGLPNPASHSGPTHSSQEESFDGGSFSPLPLVKSSNEGFEPLTPKGSVGKSQREAASAFTPMGKPSNLADTNVINPSQESPAPQDLPSAPPPRLSRISAPQLLRRQRGGQGASDPFNRS